ncbi:alpha/beta hydrolase [Psychromonas sp. RZ22]|uniref:esterase/lipase family protein n=1 Tax=Psychromonas algarum TaxID=2555643 RepID=UPI0010688DBE|nr:alpha/beta hydrolase [Psychromonas sp. RZ22]TEW56518.1 alpha/beta hydrolase [Psychromonas sp. RZ22]
MKAILILALLTVLSACSTPSYIAEEQPLQKGKLPTANTQVTIPGLGSCTDSQDRTLKFNSNEPITILVHGCNGSAGRFRSLAQLYAFHGQQTACYSYDDRDSLITTANKLVNAIEQLSAVTNNPNISIIGHSMGGLIARKAMETEQLETNNKTNIQLVTVSAPLSGIKAANSCSSNTLNWLSLGVVPGICWGITGDNWNEITATSSFIRQTKPLSSSVQRYLKVVTNEENTCRRENALGQCIESDYVFDLVEQSHPIIDSYSQVTNIQVDAGHVEIVGDKNVSPWKLLAILQEQEILAATPPEKQQALQDLLAKLY